MYTQTKKNKTSQLKANFPEKFLKDFSTYKAFPDRAENISKDENTGLKYIRNDQLLLQTKNLVQKRKTDQYSSASAFARNRKKKTLFGQRFSESF